MIPPSRPGEPLLLRTRSGEHVDAELYHPPDSRSPAPGIIVAPEMYGINGYVREVSRDIAGRGYFVLALDVFWRVERKLVLEYTGPDNARAHELHDAFDFARSVVDVQAAADALRALPGSNGKIGIVGFCLGGTLAYLAAARTDVDAAVGYYGSRIVEFLDDAASIATPLLLHFGAADAAIPEAERERVVAAISSNPAIAAMVHPGARHAFANHHRPDRYDPAATRAAEEVTFTLFERNLR